MIWRKGVAKVVGRRVPSEEQLATISRLAFDEADKVNLRYLYVIVMIAILLKEMVIQHYENIVSLKC